ncbi:MAG TPA: TlpA disulfide reductase family protein [Pyrinomonadaceae bacterium]|nr:TlpA disulfide reductase family protein [Pyrinomonadaceae bacterium]
MRLLTKFLGSLFIVAFLYFAASAQTGFTTTSGSSFDLKSQKGKVVVLAVGASWLPLSKNQASIIAELTKRFPSRNVSVFFVAIDSKNPKSKNFATDEQLQTWSIANKVTVPVLRDPDGAITKKLYGVDQIPAFVILDRNGEMKSEPVAGIDPDSNPLENLANIIDSLL